MAAILVKFCQWLDGQGCARTSPLKYCILPFLSQSRLTMPVWPLWVVVAADSKVGNTAPAPMLSEPKGYLPALNVTGYHQGPCRRYWRYWQGEQKLCVTCVKPKGENHKAGPQPSAVKPFQRSME